MAVSIGLMGLGVIGQALALNIAGRGFGVHGFDPSEHARSRARVAGLPVFDDVASLVASLPAPRQIMLSVPAGEPVDAAIDSLRPLLATGDLIADLGNSHYRETVRRGEALTATGLHFLGIGVSGGEAGARSGPAIMAGGPADAWARLGPAMEAAAARYRGEPCCALVGPGGAGHFVKMVHNGIEYAVMQLIAEIYDLASRGLGMDDAAIGALVTRWNEGPLASYLVQSTGRILGLRDERTGLPLLDVIDDGAGQKGTGAWASMAALELGVPATLLATAVFARGLSADRRDRAALLPVFTKGPAGRTTGLAADDLAQALTCGVLAAYAQGFDLMAGRLHHPLGVPRSHRRGIRAAAAGCHPAERQRHRRTGEGGAAGPAEGGGGRCCRRRADALPRRGAGDARFGGECPSADAADPGAARLLRPARVSADRCRGDLPPRRR
jgi:6-phosphogluconate dehydrogenase